MPNTSRWRGSHALLRFICDAHLNCTMCNMYIHSTFRYYCRAGALANNFVTLNNYISSNQRMYKKNYLDIFFLNFENVIIYLYYIVQLYIYNIIIIIQLRIKAVIYLLAIHSILSLLTFN